MDHNSSADTPGLDSLALTLDREISALDELDYRLNSLRLALIDGTADFVSRAATEANAAALAAAERGGPREAASRQATAELGLDAAATLVRIADAAPAPHGDLLARLLRQLASRAQAIRVQRDAIRTLAANGQRTLAGMLALDDTAVAGASIDLASEDRRGTLFVGEL